MKKLVCLCLVVSMLLGVVWIGESQAARRGMKTLSGCVVNGTLFCFATGVPDPSGRRPVQAYVQPVQGVDLRQYEGAKIHISGELVPGDSLYADPNSVKVMGPCSHKQIETIQTMPR